MYCLVGVVRGVEGEGRGGEWRERGGKVERRRERGGETGEG